MSSRKLLGSLRAKVRVALTSLAILAVGALIAPPVTPTVITPPDERALPLLEQQALARVERHPFSGIQDVAARIADRVVAIPGTNRAPEQRTALDFAVPARTQVDPAGFGVAVGPAGEVITHANALQGRLEVVLEEEGATRTARVSGFEPSSGLVLLSGESQTPASAPAFGGVPEAGALAAAYFRNGATRSLIPVFITSVDDGIYTLASSGGWLKPGTPLYDLSGQLLAIVTGESEQPTAIAAQPAVNRLLERLRAGAAQPASIGVTFQPLDGPIAGVFGQSGALVADVLPDGPGAAAGLLPGDLVVGVGDTIVMSPEAARRAIVDLRIGEPAPIRVQRGGESLTLTATPDSAYTVAARARGSRTNSNGSGLRVADVIAPARLAAAGIDPAAAIISINGQRASSLADARRQLRPLSGRVVLHLHGREGERFFAVLEPES
jgi:membrane-associated protease RseP (regulator of RpoE activity)